MAQPQKQTQPHDHEIRKAAVLPLIDKETNRPALLFVPEEGKPALLHPGVSVPFTDKPYHMSVNNIIKAWLDKRFLEKFPNLETVFVFAPVPTFVQIASLFEDNLNPCQDVSFVCMSSIQAPAPNASTMVKVAQMLIREQD